MKWYATGASLRQSNGSERARKRVAARELAAKHISEQSPKFGGIEKRRGKLKPLFEPKRNPVACQATGREQEDVL